MSRLTVLVVLALFAFAALPSCAADDPAKKELEQLQGNWTVVEYEREGRMLPADDAKKIKFEFKGDQFKLTGGVGFTGGNEGTHKLDPTKKVKEIDITPADGRNKGKTFAGIYTLDGDKLRICAAAPGEPRPTEFATKAGSKTMLITYQRDKPKEK